MMLETQGHKRDLTLSYEEALELMGMLSTALLGAKRRGYATAGSPLIVRENGKSHPSVLTLCVEGPGYAKLA